MTMSMRRITMLICSCLMYVSLAVQADNMKKDGMMDKTTTTMHTTGTMDKTMTSDKDAMAKDTMDKGGMTDTTDMEKAASDKMHDEANDKMMDKKM